MSKRTSQLELSLTPRRGGARVGAGRKRANPFGRPNVPHRKREEHVARRPVHVTMRAKVGAPGFRNELVRNLMREVLTAQAGRGYAKEFQIVHFSLQSDHIHLIVEAAAEGALGKGIRGFAISFARRLNRRVRRKGKVWGDRHYRRELRTPTETRNTLLYVLQNYVHHGMTTFGEGVVDPYSTAARFDGWADEAAALIETEPWPAPKPRTWLLAQGWLRGQGGRFTTSTPPRRAAGPTAVVRAYLAERGARTSPH